MRIKKLELAAGTLEPLARFYGSMLGLEVSKNLEVRVGSSLLIFHERSGFDGRYHFAFNVRPGQIEAAKTWLENLGIKLLPGLDGEPVVDFESWNAKALYFFDPAGNIVELIDRRDLPVDRELPFTVFSASEILCVSEIGIASEDVQGASDLLKERFGVGEYRGSGPGFVPLGDEHGLFIVVEEGRIWFPDTGVPAQKLPLKVFVQRGEDGPEREWSNFAKEEIS